MGTTAEKLQSIINSKTALKNSINAKGGAITDETPLSKYAEEVDKIQISTTLEQPTLFSPNIIRNGDTLTINKNNDNGAFQTGFKIYDVNEENSTLITTIPTTNTSTNYNLLELGAGEYSISATTYGEKFIDSPQSIINSYAIYNIVNNLTNISTSNTSSTIGIGQLYSTTLSVSDGKYLPTYIEVSMGDETTDYLYNNETGLLSIQNVIGDINITASASDYTRLQPPVITYSLDTISWEQVENASSYKVFANNNLITTTNDLYCNLTEFLTVDGIYNIIVRACGDLYQDSNPSNKISYNVGISVYGVTGLELSTPQLTRTDSNEGMSYYINSSSGVITTDFDNIFKEEYVGDNLEEIIFDSSLNYWTSDGTQYTGNVFRKINKFYKQVQVDENNYRTGFKIALANECPADYYCPAYFINESGNEMDFHLIGVYKNNHSNNKLRSISNVTPNNTSTSNYQEYGKNASNSVLNCFAKDWRSEQLILDLFMIIFATRQTQDIYNSWRTYQQTTGKSNGLRGTSQFGFDVSSNAPLFLGIEDIIGNGYEYISGVIFNGSTIKYSTTPSTDSADETNKILCSYTKPTSNNYIVKMGYDSNIPDLEIPMSVSGGSSSTYYCDYHYYNSGVRVLYRGALSVSSHRGLFSSYCYYSASDSDRAYASRLCAQPL